MGRPAPRERPERPLVVPSLLCDSALSGRLMLVGACLAAEERLLRWPAEKEDWEATVTLAVLMGYVQSGSGAHVCG